MLIAAGLERRQAVDITPILGKVATTTQASMGDLANTAYALTSNLKVPVEQMQVAFERLTVAGQITHKARFIFTQGARRPVMA